MNDSALAIGPNEHRRSDRQHGFYAEAFGTPSFFGNDRWLWYNSPSSSIVRFVQGGVVKTFRCEAKPSVKIDDYLLDHSDVDWPTVLAPWHWLLPEILTVWLVNRFGDVFAVLDDGSVYMLDVGGGTFERVADSRDHFCDLLDVDDNASDWLMTSLIDALVAADKPLKPGCCYGYLNNPVLGGDYAVANSVVIPIKEHFGLNAEIHQQIKDLPDGAQVTIEFTDD